MNDNLIGLIPAAGYATRLNYPIAKELWPIQIKEEGRIFPLINRTMENMFYAGAEHQVFVVRSDKPEIMKHTSTVYPYQIRASYVCQTKKSSTGKSSGLVDAIESAYHLIKGKTVLFGMPDTFVDPINCYVQLKNIQEQYDIALGLFETNTPQKFGMVHYDTDKKVEFFDKEDDIDKITSLTVKEIFDKPEKTDLEYMWGIIVWNAEFTELIHKCYHNYSFDFASILNMAIHEEFKVKAQIIRGGAYYDFGQQSDIIEFSNR